MKRGLLAEGALARPAKRSKQLKSMPAPLASSYDDCVSAIDGSATSRQTQQHLSCSSLQQAQQQQQPHHVMAVAADGPAGATATDALEGLLRRALADADTALHLTTNAMGLATHICGGGTSSAANAALTIAEQTLAATMQQLAVAQALVAHKAAQQQQHLYSAGDDEDLQDTCSSTLVCP